MLGVLIFTVVFTLIVIGLIMNFKKMAHRQILLVNQI